MTKTKSQKARRRAQAAQRGGLQLATYVVPRNRNAGGNLRSRPSRNQERQVQQALRAQSARNGAAAASPAVSQMSQAPAAASRVRRQSAPRIQMAGNGERCRIRHREYVAEVSGSTAFATTTYVFQPALQTLFNWLASIAGNFEKYRLLRVRFCYETENATSQGGSIMYAFDWDVLDSAPLSKQALMSYKSSVRAAPWQEFHLDLDMSDSQRDWYYTRSGSVPSGADQKLYDMGNLFVATQNANGASGELYVEYEIELAVPQTNITPISGKTVGAGTMSATQLIGTTASYSSGSNVGWSLGTDGTTFTCLVAGDYLFVNALVGTGLTAPLVSGGTSTQTIPSASNVANAAGTASVGVAVVRAQVGETFAPTMTAATTVTQASWRISRYQYALA